MIMMSMQFLGKANSMFRLWFVIGNFLCTIDSTVEVEAIGLVLLGSCNKCLPFSSANSEAYAHSGWNIARKRRSPFATIQIASLQRKQMQAAFNEGERDMQATIHMLHCIHNSHVC